MPYPNEHAARQIDPSRYAYFRRVHPTSFPDGLDVIYGVTQDGKVEVQTFRATATQWSVERFADWLQRHGYKTEIEPVGVK